MSSITMKQGEGKDITFTYTLSGVVQDVSSNTFYFAVKESTADAAALIEKNDGDFDKTNASSGIVVCNITATESAALDEGEYIAEIRMIATADTDVDKSQDITFTITDSAT